MKISSCTGIAAYFGQTVPFNRPDTSFINKKTKNTFFDKHGCPEYTQSRQNNHRQTKQVPRTGE